MLPFIAKISRVINPLEYCETDTLVTLPNLEQLEAQYSSSKLQDAVDATMSQLSDG
jgi:hypothetical protein